MLYKCISERDVWFRDLPDGINDFDVTVHHADRVHPAAALRRSSSSTSRSLLDAPTLRLPRRYSTGRPTSTHQPVSTKPCRRQPGRVAVSRAVSTSSAGELRRSRSWYGVARWCILTAGCAIGTGKQHGTCRQSTATTRP